MCSSSEASREQKDELFPVLDKIGGFRPTLSSFPYLECRSYFMRRVLHTLTDKGLPRSSAGSSSTRVRIGVIQPLFKSGAKHATFPLTNSNRWVRLR